MRVEFAASIAKEPDVEALNEDTFLFSLDASVASLSDGASESFDSKSWASQLCAVMCSGERIAADTISSAVREYSALYDAQSLSWSRAAAFERGSFATLLRMHHRPNRSEVEVLAVGDSVVVFFEAGELVRKFPLTEPEQFNERPELLSTRDELNLFLRDSVFPASYSLVQRVTSSTVALLLTDAIAQWFYSELQIEGGKWRALLSIDSELDLRNIVLAARADKSMKLDDATLIRLTF